MGLERTGDYQNPRYASRYMDRVERIAQREASANAASTFSVSNEVARYLALRYGLSDQEVMGGLYLDTRNRLLAEREVYRGTLNRAAVEPRALLKQGLLRDAAGLVLFHTHPSGDGTRRDRRSLLVRRLGGCWFPLGARE